ncbi:MAG: hypothetical protein CO129_05560 [Ignavibacteriales bacterium CG_4_9_14_3_um_filter_34_10]|nr:MAG: hypothetical protein CO129_05560 [Ignavibacteriales bacterium CG_4_9_14_3_um_filter_34_10]
MNKCILMMLVFLFAGSSLSAKNYKGAEYRTNEAFVYGRFEARFKPARKEAVVSSFFTYHEFTSETGWNEIDIEFIGRNDNHVQFNIITPNQKFHIRNQYLDFDPYLDFHNYAFEWTPDYLAYFVDGKEVWKTTDDFVKTLIYPQKLMMNIWNPVYTNWVGTWSDNLLPAIAEYDYITYSSYTQGSGNYGTENNFTLQWKDDLDNFDETRWRKATHTFGGNQADFIVENAVHKNGSMFLCLTDPYNLGLQDKVKPELLYARENYDSSVTCMFSEEVDSVSALNKSNFIIPGLTVSDIKFLEDRRSVKLFFSNYDLGVTYNLIVNNITDIASPANKMNLKAVTVNKINSLSFPVKINIGGNAFEDYLPDQEWSNKVEYGYQMGDSKKWNPAINVTGTDKQELFHTERKGMVDYKIRVPNGTYKIKLGFADNGNTAAGQRAFDIYAEGKLIAENMDVFALVGKNSVYEVNDEVSVHDEKIDIYFCDDVDSAFVNVIEIEKMPNSVGQLGNAENLLDFSLEQNYPNPFNPSTTISFKIPNSTEYYSVLQNVTLKVYDTLGREVATLVNENKQPGFYHYTFSTIHYTLSSGVYFYTLHAGDFIETKKMVLMK